MPILFAKPKKNFIERNIKLSFGNLRRDPSIYIMDHSDLVGVVLDFIIPHVKSPYKTSIDERLTLKTIIRC